MSPVPITVPSSVCDIDRSSMVVEIAASTTIARKFVLISSPEPPALVADLALGLRSGVPLDRPAELLSLAEEVLAGPTGFPETWATDLATDFARFDD